MALLECIPNFSEGRRPRIIERLARAARLAGARQLDLSADGDHHRAVLTLAGDQETLLTALLALYRQALADIDLRQHHGVHPRIGALDVCPFVPLGATSMATAVHLAKVLAERVGSELRLPVYLYGQAARSDRNRQLADLRRGGLKALAARLRQASGWPDFGPAELHPSAGATAIGARFFLIAFNIVLDCPDPAPAKGIASRVREVGGGLPAVRALGVELASRRLSQVSMNLVDYRQTSPHAAFATVAAEAERLGVEVLSSEFVGLVPTAALADGPLAELRLEGYSEEMLLENRLHHAGLSS